MDFHLGYTQYFTCDLSYKAVCMDCWILQQTLVGFSLKSGCDVLHSEMDDVLISLTKSQLTSHTIDASKRKQKETFKLYLKT